MPRIDRRRLRTGLRLGLPDDPLSSRGFATALRVQLVGSTAVLLGLLVLPNVSRDDRVFLLAVVAVLVACLGGIKLTLGTKDPRLAWSIATVLVIAAIAVAMFAVPDVYLASLIASTMVVAATTAIGGLGIGLVTSLVAAVLALTGSFLATGDSSEIALACGIAMVAYPTIVLSIDGFTLSRHRAATQLARLHETLRTVSAEPSLSATLDSLVEAVRGAFGSDSAVVLLRVGDQLELAAPGVLPLPRWTDRVSRLTATALASTDATPVALAMSRGETVVVRDIATDPRFTSGGSNWRERLLGIGLASMVVVPLRLESTPVGLFHVCFQRPGALDDDELALLEAYADQATIVITRAQAYAELEAADALKSEFLATVSHELRTPLTAAKGFVDTVLLQWERLDDTQRRQLLQRASANADELARLIDQLLDYSRLDAGTVRVHPVDVELAPFVERMVERMAPVLEDHRVVVEPGDPLSAWIDPDAFAHVLGNLLTNAANFSPAGSPIRVVIAPGDRCALISVRDEGIGIASHEHERIFERFYRVSDDSGSGRGTGIGLAIAARFVELLGGRVWVESAPGAGSTFWISLPLAGAEGPAAAETAADAAAPQRPEAVIAE